MHEKALGIYDSMVWAMDEVDKDMQINPIEYLGIALYPSSLFQYAAFVSTLLFALLEQKLS